MNRRGRRPRRPLQIQPDKLPRSGAFASRSGLMVSPPPLLKTITRSIKCQPSAHARLKSRRSPAHTQRASNLLRRGRRPRRPGGTMRIFASFSANPLLVPICRRTGRLRPPQNHPKCVPISAEIAITHRPSAGRGGITPACGILRSARRRAQATRPKAKNQPVRIRQRARENQCVLLGPPRASAPTMGCGSPCIPRNG